jgi:hypothetical protein
MRGFVCLESLGILNTKSQRAALAKFPMRLPPPPPNAPPDVNHFAGLPTIFTILSKLGLELNRQQDILPVYTVERIERPAAN